MCGRGPGGVGRPETELFRLSRDQCPAHRVSLHLHQCIDVMSELESCGGCIEGEYGNPTKPLGKV